MHCLEIINENPLFIFITSIMTIISIPISIYLFFHSLGVKNFKYIFKWYIFDKDNEQLPIGLQVPQHLLDKAPSYYAIQCPPNIHTRGGVVISRRPENEPISMYDRNDNICIAKFALWNSGIYCLKAEDVVPDKRIQIHNHNLKIIAASIIMQEEDTNHISVDLINDHVVEITFDYIDKHEGAVIAIAYTGSPHYSDCFYFTGKVLGGWKLKHVFNNENQYKRVQRNYFHEIKLSTFFNWGLIFSFSLTSLFLFYSIISSLLPLLGNKKDTSLLGTLFLFIPWFIASVLTLLSCINNILIPKKIWKSFNTGHKIVY